MSFLFGQNQIVDKVFEPFYDKFPYDLEQIKKLKPSFPLENLEKPAILEAHFVGPDCLTNAKKMLAYFMWQMLNDMADKFQQNRDRPLDDTALITYLKEVQALMEMGLRINRAIEAHFKKKYHCGMSSRLGRRLNAVIAFCKEQIAAPNPSLRKKSLNKACNFFSLCQRESVTSENSNLSSSEKAKTLSDENSCSSPRSSTW